MSNLHKVKEEKYIPKYFNEAGELTLLNVIPNELERWNGMTALEAIKRGLVRTIHFITP